MLLKIARAVFKGHLKPTSWIAQRLATTGTNLVKDATNTWQFSQTEHRFYSLMRKISRPAVELLRGSMHVDSLPDDLKVSTALFNEVVPSRQPTQQWDAKYADNHHFQTMGMKEKLIAQMTDELCEDSQHVEACLCWDATDVAPNVVTAARNQNVEWHGYHDLSSTSISDTASDQQAH